jgi:hypothetical protein
MGDMNAKGRINKAETAEARLVLSHKGLEGLKKCKRREANGQEKPPPQLKGLVARILGATYKVLHKLNLDSASHGAKNLSSQGLGFATNRER